MALQHEEIKTTSIRWPGELWEAVAKEAITRRTTLNALVLEAVSEFLRIPMPDEQSKRAASAASRQD